MIIYPHLLFITNREDFTTDYLILQLQNHSIPYLRINSEDISELPINFQPQSSIRIGINGTTYDLMEVKAVYFRRAPTVFPKAVNLPDTSFINRERKDFFEGIYLGLCAKWINPIYSTYIAERKLYQLRLASQLGLNIPKTLVTNDPNEITSFADQQSQGVVIKPISHGLQFSEEGIFSIYTSEINTFEFCQDKRLFESPVLLQEKVKNFCDLRITVVGNNYFAVEISKSNSLEVDWRKPAIGKNYKTHDLPGYLKSQIANLHQKLNLCYSAIDFIITPEKEYVFLEINPAGEWIWLEKELGLPISSSLIGELIGRNHSDQ